MSNQITGILIDPFLKTCTAVDVGKGELEDLYRILECSMVEMTSHLSNGDSIYVDEEGLFKKGNVSFSAAGIRQPLFGRGLILGHNDDGDCTGPKTPFSTWVNAISFLPQFQIGDVDAI